MREDLEMLVESVLITEMDQDVVDYVENEIGDHRPFDHIFGDSYRITIPFITDPTIYEFLNSLKKIKGYSGLDVSSQEVHRKVALDPKYGRGDSTIQKVNFGRALKNADIDPDKKKKLLDWYAVNKDKLETKDDDYMIILSRSPVDVVRMSDHANISSCHSRGGSYFECAVQEALTGGAVAYLIRTKDYEHLMEYVGEDALEEDDVFTDRDRREGHITPLARLRIRRVEMGDKELAIPEERVYGNNIPGFVQSVMGEVKLKQEDYYPVEKIINDMERIPTIASRGGTYFDNSIGDLISKYVGDGYRIPLDVGHNREDYSSERRHSFINGRAAQLGEEMEEVIDDYRYDYSVLEGSVEEETDDPYIMATAYTDFDLVKAYAKIDMEELESQLSEIKSIQWDSYAYKNKSKDGSLIGNFLEEVMEGVDDEGLTLCNINIIPNGIRFFFEDRNGSTTFFDAGNEFNRFASDLKDYDKKYDENIKVILKAIYTYLLDNPNENSSRVEAYMENDEDPEWEHFEIDYDESTTYSVTVQCSLTNHFYSLASNDQTLPQKYINAVIAAGDFNFKKALENMFSDVFRPKPKNVEQLSFKKFFESVQANRGIHDYVDFTMDISHRFLEIKTNTPDDEFFEFIDTLDAIYPHIEKLQYYIYELVKNKLINNEMAAIKDPEEAKKYYIDNIGGRDARLYMKYIK